MAALLELQFAEAPPRLLYTVHREYACSSGARTPNSNFLRGTKWSPDGACLLTASDDNCLRIYDTPLEAFQLSASAGSEQTPPAPGEAATAADAAAQGAAAQHGGVPDLQPAGQRVPAQPPAVHATAAGGAWQGGAEKDSMHPALRIQEGELLYDYCWYPGMTAAEPASCCLAATGRAQPVHLWDALTGELRCTYRAYDEMDEVAPAHSLAFSRQGDRLYCGFNRTVREFRVERPGRDCRVLMAYKKGSEGLPGIVSCLAPNPDGSGMLAAGSYSGAAALLDSRTRELLCVLEGGHTGGVTHLCFSADGNYLYTGARKDPAILCWDVRYASGVLYSMQRASSGTNQRIYFSIEPCGRHLATGGEDGVVRLFDLRDGSLAALFAAADDTVNGVDFHPFLPLLATSSGQRRYPLAPADVDSSSDSSASDDSDADMPSSSDSGSASSDGGGEGRPPTGAFALSAQENALGVWRCWARPLALPDVHMADAGAAVAAEGAAGAAVAAAEGAAGAAVAAAEGAAAAAAEAGHDQGQTDVEHRADALAADAVAAAQGAAAAAEAPHAGSEEAAKEPMAAVG